VGLRADLRPVGRFRGRPPPEAIPLFAVESAAPVRDFDVVGFSLQSELNYTNVPNLLDLAGVPVLSAERGTATRSSSVGPCVANPEPVADLFDLFLIGDGEEAFPRFLEEVERTKGLSRRERFLRFAVIRGSTSRRSTTWCTTATGSPRSGRTPPAFPSAPRASGSRSSRRRSTRTSRWSRPSRSSRTGSASRSCGLHAGLPLLPGRLLVPPGARADPADVARATKAFIDEAGWSEVGLLSLSSADYSQIEPLVACLAPELAKTKVSISLPSLRAEAFSVALADAVSEVRKSGFTFRPRNRFRPPSSGHQQDVHERGHGEGGRRRLRTRLDLIKVYTMIGLPTETDADLTSS